jgi:hypothetical protein
MRLGNVIKCLMFSALLLSFDACKGGKSDKDGNKSIEGHSDPANTGGKLSGDHDMDQASGVNDSTSGNTENK